MDAANAGGPPPNKRRGTLPPAAIEDTRGVFRCRTPQKGSSQRLPCRARREALGARGKLTVLHRGLRMRLSFKPPQSLLGPSRRLPFAGSPPCRNAFDTAFGTRCGSTRVVRKGGRHRSDAGSAFTRPCRPTGLCVMPSACRLQSLVAAYAARRFGVRRLCEKNRRKIPRRLSGGHSDEKPKNAVCPTAGKPKRVGSPAETGEKRRRPVRGFITRYPRGLCPIVQEQIK